MMAKGKIFSIIFCLLFIISVSYLDLTHNTEPRRGIDEPTIEALSAPTNSSCYSCHINLKNLLNGSISKSSEDWSGSIHYSNMAVIMCSNCHGGNASTNIIYDSMYEEGGYIANYSKERSNEICGKCHQDEYNYFLESVHWAGEDNNSKLRCGDCHNIHDVISVNNPKSPVYLENIAKTCGKCHLREYESYAKTFHGKNLNFDNLNAAVCSDCHSSHLVLPETNPNSTLYPSNFQKVCSGCHKNDYDAKILDGIFHDDEDTHNPNLLFNKDELTNSEKRYFIGPVDLAYYIPFIYNIMIVVFVFSLISLILLETVFSKVFRRDLPEE